MKWYDGNIAEAVTLSRTKGAVFIVYIQGKDDKSNEFSATINTEQVSQLLQSDNFVAIQIEADSLSHRQFSEIYKATSIPSVYFIGKSGSPLEILTEPLNVLQMVDKINEIIVKNGGTAIKSENQFIKAETSDTASTSNEEIQQPIEDRLKVAQELIEKKRQEKKAEDEQKERDKEVERRKLGQDVQKMKKWQHEQELKNLMEDRQKEKRAEQEARDRVRRQIEEDKREKAARMNNFIATNQPVAAEPAKPSARSSNSNIARLQFRLPDGSSNTNDFQSSSTLQEVINYIKANLNLYQFKLSTTFPRREFSDSDANNSLLDLQLVPNAVILVLPSNKGGTVSTSNDNGGLVGMIWHLLSPILSIFSYLKGFIFGSNPEPRPERTSNTEEANPQPSSSTSPSGSKYRAGGTTTIRRSGNIHRLSDKDSDDDNNTWNGNSTQQM